jgi:F-box domain
MPVPDLPVELWMLIMLHLSPNDATKLMGVCSTLCQLALDYKYGVLCLVGTSPDQLRVLERLG